MRTFLWARTPGSTIENHIAWPGSRLFYGLPCRVLGVRLAPRSVCVWKRLDLTQDSELNQLVKQLWDYYLKGLLPTSSLEKVARDPNWPRWAWSRWHYPSGCQIAVVSCFTSSIHNYAEMYFNISQTTIYKQQITNDNPRTPWWTLWPGDKIYPSINHCTEVPSTGNSNLPSYPLMRVSNQGTLFEGI